MAAPPSVADLLREAATGARRLTPDELRRVLEHVAHAGFDPTPNARAGGRLAGMAWQGRVLKGSDRLPPAEVHYLRHVVARPEWPPGTTLGEYLDSIRAVILDAESGVLLSSWHGLLHLTVVRRSGSLRGPEGEEYVMVEYRVDHGYWTTAFQPAAGIAYITDDPERLQQR